MNLLGGLLTAVALVSPPLPLHPTEASTPTASVVTTPHFTIYTDATAAAWGPILTRLELVYEALAKSFFAGVPVPRADVVLLGRRADFDALAPAGLTGFYLAEPEFMAGDELAASARAGSGSGLLVLSAEAGREDVLTTAAHELAHHFLHAVGDRIPVWLHEGFAKYVGALVVTGQRVTFDAAPLAGAWAVTQPIALAELLGSDVSFHGASARAQYLTAWLLVGRLLASAPATPGAWFQRLVAEAASGRTAAHAGFDRALRRAHAALRNGRAARARPGLAVRISDARVPMHVRAAAPGELSEMRSRITRLLAP